MSDENENRLIDTAGEIEIGQGYTLAWVIETDGATWPVLRDTRQLEPQFMPYLPEHWRDLAPHEMEGRLPDRFEQFRCGAPAHKGKACRSRVPAPGIHCRHHRETVGPLATAPVAEPTLFDLDSGAES